MGMLKGHGVKEKEKKGALYIYIYTGTLTWLDLRKKCWSETFNVIMTEQQREHFEKVQVLAGVVMSHLLVSHVCTTVSYAVHVVLSQTGHCVISTHCLGNTKWKQQHFSSFSKHTKNDTWYSSSSDWCKKFLHLIFLETQKTLQLNYKRAVTCS